MVRETLVDDRDHRGENNVAEFSSRGPTYDGRIKPDLLAPGQNIISTHGDGSTRSHQCGTQPPRLDNNAARLSMQGTSMATPTAAGNAALVRQYFVDGYYPSTVKNAADSHNPSGALVKAMMIASTIELTGDIDKGNNGTWTRVDPIWPSYSIFQGFGKVQLNNVMRLKNDKSYNMFADDVWQSGLTRGGGVDSNDTVNYCFKLTPSASQPGGRIRAALVWDDYPGEGGCASALCCLFHRSSASFVQRQLRLSTIWIW